jgi:hypothetical protein
MTTDYVHWLETTSPETAVFMPANPFLQHGLLRYAHRTAAGRGHGQKNSQNEGDGAFRAMRNVYAR